MTNSPSAPTSPLTPLAAFAQKLIRHPHLDAVHHALLATLQDPAGASLVLVYGPTGVGKTTIRRRIEQQVLAANQAAMTRQPGYLPIASFAAIASDNGQFNWKDYYIRTLVALADPLLEPKIGYGIRGIRTTETGQPLVAADVPAPELRRAVERALAQRRPQALLIDEAQHFAKLAGGRRLLDQMDVLKSLAETTNTVHVLFGTYALLELRNLSGQLGRRSRELHLGRYRFEQAEDRQSFQTILRTFQRALPLREEPDLVRHDQWCYERSLGCVGVLKNWLTRALARAFADDAPTLTLAHLEQTAESPQTLLQMARELRDGEQLLTPPAAAEERIRECLVGATVLAEPAARVVPVTTHRAGERLPQRDPVEETRQ